MLRVGTLFRFKAFAVGQIRSTSRRSLVTNQILKPDERRSDIAIRRLTPPLPRGLKLNSGNGSENVDPQWRHTQLIDQIGFREVRRLDSGERSAKLSEGAKNTRLHCCRQR